jgi:hypothetical protein
MSFSRLAPARLPPSEFRGGFGESLIFLIYQLKHLAKPLSMRVSTLLTNLIFS